MSLQVLKGETPGQGANTVNNCSVEKGILHLRCAESRCLHARLRATRACEMGVGGMYGNRAMLAGFGFPGATAGGSEAAGEE